MPRASDGHIVVKRKPKKCPACGASPVARVVYGLAPWHPDFDAGLAVIGGCCLGPDMPAWRCVKCETDIFKQETTNG